MSDTESIIRAIKLARIGGQDRWPFSDDDIEEILEALQLKEDLEVIARYSGEAKVQVATNDRWCVESLQGVVFRDSVADAIHAAAEAIRKGGE